MKSVQGLTRHDSVIVENWDEASDTALFVLAKGWASIAQITTAVLVGRAQRPKIGELAIREEKLTMAQVFRILEQEATHGGLFGENAIEMGLLSKPDLYELLLLQAQKTPRLTATLLAQGILNEQQVESIKNSGRSSAKCNPQPRVTRMKAISST